MVERNLELAEIIIELGAIQARLALSLPQRLRPYLNRFEDLPRACLILGPRGCGKTTFILNYLRQKNCLFVSADLPWIAPYSLWEIAKAAFSHGYEGIIFDEVHYAEDWSKHIKAIYDSYPKHLIWASDSSSAVLRKGVADLSRRFLKIQIPILSFREYIYLREGKLFQTIDPFSPDSSKIHEVLDQINVPLLFRQHISSGIRPIFQEGFYEDRSLNILEKMIFSDLLFFVPQMQENYYRALKSILSYLASASIPRLNLERLCKEWGIGKEKLYQLLSVAEEIHLIRIIKYSNQRTSHTKGAKIFLHDPSWYSVLKGELGNQREAYVVSALSELGLGVSIPKDDSECDFVTSSSLKLEIGGRNKSSKKADFVIRDDLDVPSGKAIPLWLLGMGY